MVDSGSALRHTREAIGLSQAKLAEATGIAQHIISAFELGKFSLNSEQATRIASILNDKQSLSSLISRKKRYQNHHYSDARHDAGRRARCTQTSGNIEYCGLLNQLHSTQAPERLSAINLFSGCGGFSLGFSWAGFDIRGYLEFEAGLSSIYTQNFPGCRELGTDITAISDDEISRVRDAIGEIDVIIGGPPCQGFSLSGKRNVKDPRNSLFRHYLRFVDAYRPQFAIMENVRLLMSMRSPNGGFIKPGFPG